MVSQPSAVVPWDALPTEMKFSVAAQLDDPADLRAFSQVSKDAYAVAVPALWRIVDLPHLEAVQSYITNVPHAYHRYIRQLTISTAPKGSAALVPHPAPAPHSVSAAVAALLTQCTQLEQLTLNLAGALTPAVVPCFERLHCLTALTINHVGDQQSSPLSERLVVSIAASVPNLHDLSLDRISRSALHAPELIGAYPLVPVVSGDGDIPPHALLGADLSLPSLLRLPTLKKLRIRDTHLGDPKWPVAPLGCALELLDLGSCCQETPDFNRVCTERIVGAVGHTVGEFALNTPISTETFAFEQPKETPLKKLRKLHITPLFPVEDVVDTLATLSGSPVEALSVRCHEDDVVDMCSALTDFLSLRVERGEHAFYKSLTHIDVATVADVYEAPPRDGFRPAAVSLPAEHARAVQQLQAFCRDLRLAADTPLGDAACICPAEDVGTGKLGGASAV